MARVSRERALATSGLLTALSIVGLSVAHQMQQGIVQSVISSVSSATLSIGVVSLIYESMMRDLIQKELIDLVGVARTIAATGLVSIEKTENFSWARPLSTSRRVRAILADPKQWIDSNFETLVAAARISPIEIEVLLQDPESPHVAAGALFHGRDTAAYAANLRESAETAEATWKNRLGLLHQKSMLRVKMFSGVCTKTLVVLDSQLVVVGYSPNGRVGVDNGLVEVFEIEGAKYPAAWLIEHLEAASKSATVRFEHNMAEV